MSAVEQAYSEHRRAVEARYRKRPPIQATLGAFIEGAFTILNDRDPSEIWVRMAEDGSPRTVKHEGRVNWELTDQSIPIELYVNDDDKLAFHDWDTNQAGPLYEQEGGNLAVPPHTQAATTITVVPTSPLTATNAQAALDEVAELLDINAVNADIDARLLDIVLQAQTTPAPTWSPTVVALMDLLVSMRV